MHKGDDVHNFKELENQRTTLGQTLGMLEQMDNEEYPYFSQQI